MRRSGRTKSSTLVLALLLASPASAEFYSASECALMVVSLSDAASVRRYVERMPDRRNVRVFLSESNLYGVAADIVGIADARTNLARWREEGAVPSDAYCAPYNRFLAEVDWRTGDTIARRAQAAADDTQTAPSPARSDDLLPLVPEGAPRDAAAAQVRSGANFAGHTFFVTWGCGSGCAQAGVLDPRSARWRALPFTMHRDLGQDAPLFEASVGSDVVSASGWRNEDEIGRFRYRWDGEDFELVDSSYAPETGEPEGARSAGAARETADADEPDPAGGSLLYAGEPCRYGVKPGATAPNTEADFVNHGDGTVTHRKTGLMWARCQIGNRYDPDFVLGYPYCSPGDQRLLRSRYPDAAAEAARTTVNGKTGWRIPTLSELKSLEEPACRGGFVFNNDVFVGATSADYWSSTLSDVVQSSSSNSRRTFNSKNAYVGYLPEGASSGTLLVRD